MQGKTASVHLHRVANFKRPAHVMTASKGNKRIIKDYVKDESVHQNSVAKVKN